MNIESVKQIVLNYKARFKAMTGYEKKKHLIKVFILSVVVVALILILSGCATAEGKPELSRQEMISRVVVGAYYKLKPAGLPELCLRGGKPCWIHNPQQEKIVIDKICAARGKAV